MAIACVLIMMISCNVRSRVKISKDQNESEITTIFSISSIDDSLSSFMRSFDKDTVFTITCYNVNGDDKLIFWAGIGIPLRISRKNDNLHVCSGMAKRLDSGKIIAIDSLSLNILTPIIDSSGFTVELYSKLQNLYQDHHVVIACRKIYKMIDLRELEPVYEY